VFVDVESETATQALLQLPAAMSMFVVPEAQPQSECTVHSVVQNPPTEQYPLVSPTHWASVVHALPAVGEAGTVPDTERPVRQNANGRS
jgi:hypothetical protein